MSELEHCYGHSGCNGADCCACDCRACEKLSPLYRAFWCQEHPGKKHVHRGFRDESYRLTAWRCVDA